MAINNAMQLDKAKELDRIRESAKKALILLTTAEYNACELSNRNLLDYKQARAISTYFDRALEPLRELIEYLESLEDGVNVEKAIAQLYDGTKINGQLTTDNPASSYGQKVFVDDNGQAIDWAMIVNVEKG